MRKFQFLVLVMLLVTAGVLVAQEDESEDIQLIPVDADNVAGFGSVLLVDFVDLPGDVGSVDSGWFVLSPDGRYASVVRQDGGLVVYDTLTGDVADTYTVIGESGEPATVLEAAYSADGSIIAALHTDGAGYLISLRAISGDGETLVLPFEPVETVDDMPVRIWLDDETPYVWLEVAAGTFERYFYVARYPLPGAEDTQVISLPSGPEMDMESFVRIGRIEAPLAITATADGLVKRWDLETGKVTATVQLDVPPVFGRVDDTTGRYLAWRDPASEALNLLDFEGGDNLPIAPLGGEYVQAILLTPPADVVFAVAIGDDPVVVAWASATGERFDLGPYRTCGRVPDMVRLSADGTTLVIGCDVGLDIWRISGEA